MPRKFNWDDYWYYNNWPFSAFWEWLTPKLKHVLNKILPKIPEPVDLSTHQYYYQLDDRELGPVSLEFIRKVAKGHPGLPVRLGNLNPLQRADTFPELSDLFQGIASQSSEPLPVLAMSQTVSYAEAPPAPQATDQSPDESTGPLLAYASNSTPLLTDEDGNPILCYFYWIQGKRFGPVSLEQLRKGRLPPQTWVLTYGTTEPKRACQLSELSDLYPNPPSDSRLTEPDPEFPRPTPADIHTLPVIKSSSNTDGLAGKALLLSIISLIAPLFGFFTGPTVIYVGCLLLAIASGVYSVMTCYKARQQAGNRQRTGDALLIVLTVLFLALSACLNAIPVMLLFVWLTGGTV